MSIRPWRCSARHAVWLAAIAALALLTACGGGRTSTGLIKRVNPPSASLERLAASDPAAPVRLALRVQNFSTVPTRFERIDAAITLDGMPAGRVLATPDIEIPGLTSDVVDVAWTPAAGDRARVDAAARDGRVLRYRLEGTIRTIEPAGTFDFEFESRLTPVPGRPGEFR